MSEPTIARMFSLVYAPSVAAYGIELELEQVDCVVEEIAGLRECTEDNSLRNNGREFISTPVSKQDALAFFDAVMGPNDNVKWFLKSLRCNERGSVHVHVNMAHRTPEQVKKFIRFYAILEAEFFAFVDSHRRNNIYCVPLASTRMLKYVHSRVILNYVNLWHKYTALNVKPLKDLGTIEFRHLQATEDRQVFSDWLDIISRLEAMADNETFDVRSWYDVQTLQWAVFCKEMTNPEEVRWCFHEDLLCQQTLSPTILTQRIKESKKPCVV